MTRTLVHKVDSLRVQRLKATLQRERLPLSEQDYGRLKQELRMPYLLFFKILRVTGLRQAEVFPLTPERLRRDGPDHWLSIKRAKKKDARWEEVALNPEVAEELHGWIAAHAMSKQQTIFMFSRRRFEELVSAAGDRALGRRVTPHMLRWLYETEVQQRGLTTGQTAALMKVSEAVVSKHYTKFSSGQLQTIARSVQG